MVPSESASPSAIDVDTLVTQLRRKQGTWVEWGKACQALQKSGMSPQQVFESTGFEPIHQNLVIVAAQVHASIVAAQVPESVISHFQQRGSDILYEIRILSQADRARAAELALEHGLDADTIKDVAKALKEYSYLKELPHGFTDAAGDAVAYSYWRLTRQQSDLQARSRLIGQGLRFAKSDSARQQVEKLLTDFTVVKERPAPTLPAYRLETDSELPLLVPVAGALPITAADLAAVPVTVPEEPFGIVRCDSRSAWAPVPGWQVMLQAEDPVGILARVHQLPNVQNPNSTELVLVIIDRAQRTWDEDGYFLVDNGDEVGVTWFPDPPEVKLLGRLIVIMRPKRILDENYTRELFQFEE